MLDIVNQDHFDKVCKFARSVGLMDQLQEKLDYLSHYAYHPDADPPRPENRCVLGYDFAPHSFAFEMHAPDERDETGWRHWFSGGLIFQGPACPANGSAPSYTVSLAEGTGWFVHT